MSKNLGIQSTLGKPSSKEFVRIKAKLKEHEAKSKQYDSLCYDIDDCKHMHSIVPYDKYRKASKKDCRQNSSPAKLIRSKSRTAQSNRKTDESNVQRNISDLYCELMTIKSEYKTLKSSYNVLLVQKNQLTAREQTERDTAGMEIQKCHKELEKERKNGKLMQQEIERIKKECYKILETQRFKQKKLEEIIQEKDLMIAFLRNQIDKTKKGVETTLPSANQSALSFLNNPPLFNYDFLKSSFNESVSSNVVIEQGSFISKSKGKHDEDSLSFSRDKSKEMDSIHSLLTSNDLANGNFTKKDLVILQSHQQKSEPSQCLTFQQREDQQNVFGHQSKKQEKDSRLKEEKRKGPPNMSKQFVNKQKGSRQNSTRLVIMTDENIDINTCESSVGTKKNTTYRAPSRFHKKTPTKRNKP